MSIIEGQNQPDPGSQESTRQRGRNNLTWILLGTGLLFMVAAPTIIVVAFGLLPTLVAFIIDRSKGKSATWSVGGMNFIGVFPYIVDLWMGDNSFNQALTTIADVFALLVMYASAAFGWLLFMATPQVISSFVLILQQRRVALLRSQQKELIEEWGPEVAAMIEDNLALGEDVEPHVPAATGAPPA